MSVRVKITWRTDPDELVAKLEREIAKATTKAAEEMAREASRQVEHMGAVDTGELRDNMKAFPAGMAPNGDITGSRTSAATRAEADHGILVNYGTERMPARPFWEAAIANIRRTFHRDMKRAGKRAMK